MANKNFVFKCNQCNKPIHLNEKYAVFESRNVTREKEHNGTYAEEVELARGISAYCFKCTQKNQAVKEDTQEFCHQCGKKIKLHKPFFVSSIQLAQTIQKKGKLKETVEKAHHTIIQCNDCYTANFPKIITGKKASQSVSGYHSDATNPFKLLKSREPIPIDEIRAKTNEKIVKATAKFFKKLGE